MHLENSVNRNRVTHIHEVVHNLVHWFDDKVFMLCPTWDDCERAGFLTRPQLEAFFGPNTSGGGGYANYAQCAERGIGRRIVAKMLLGTAGDEDIRKALENLPISDQRRRYEADQAEKERQEAERLRHEAARQVSCIRAIAMKEMVSDVGPSIVTEVGLRIPSDLPEEQFFAIGHTLSRIERGMQ